MDDAAAEAAMRDQHEAGMTAGGDGQTVDEQRRQSVLGAGDHPSEAGDGWVGVFDPHNPPSAERIADCVHCGFCLPACPTYSLWGEEMDSPRGRIYLMKLGREGRAELDDTFVRHIDACLGCMACVTACPSGVRYDELIEATRPQIERHYERSAADRAFRSMLFALFPNPGRLRVAALLGLAYRRLGLQDLARRSGLIARLPDRLAAVEGLLPPVTPADLVRRVPEYTPAAGPARRRVGLLLGCVQRVFFGQVNEATIRVLAAEGCEVVAPATQACCGALALHAGKEPEALERARDLIDAFEDSGVDTVVVNAAGCGSSMKDYGRLLADDPEYAERAAAFSARVRDVTELLAELEPRAERHPVAARVAYHDACHLGHAQGVTAEPRQVLRSIPDVELVELPDAAMCCGSAGIYNLVEPAAAAELGRRKAAGVREVAPDALVTANPGCLLQLRRHLDGDPAAGRERRDPVAGPDGELPLLHPVELLDASIRGADPLADRLRAAPAAPPGRALAVGGAALAGGAAVAAVVALARRRARHR
jgi:glycolate oxidase iron-sulfur subunit